MKKVFVAGAGGFIGRNLVEQLGTAYEISAPTHAELELMDAAAVREYFRGKSFDAVIICSAKPGHRNAPDPDGLLDANTRQFFNIARNPASIGRLIFIGSGMVYGQRHYEPKMKEEYFDSHVPDDEAGYAKYLIARHIELCSDAVELRPFGVYGKYEDYAIRFISNAICKTLFGLPVTLRQNRLFDYIAVEDLIYVIGRFIERKPQLHSYNVTPDCAVDLKTVAEKVIALSGTAMPLRVAKEGMGTEYSGDNSRLKRELPDFPRVSLDEGIRQLYNWYAVHRGDIDRNLLLTDK